MNFQERMEIGKAEAMRVARRGGGSGVRVYAAGAKWKRYAPEKEDRKDVTYWRRPEDVELETIPF